MERSQNSGLSGSQMARIGRVLAEPRRVQMLREIAACEEPTPCTRLRGIHRVSAATPAIAIEIHCAVGPLLPSPQDRIPIVVPTLKLATSPCRH